MNSSVHSRHQAAPAKKKGHAGAIALGVFGSALVIAYGAGAIAFHNFYYPNTQIAGTDVSLMTQDAAISKVKSALGSYKLTITGNSFSVTYKPDSTDMLIDAESATKTALDANEPLIWPVRLFESLTAPTRAQAETKGSGSDNAVELPQGFDTQALYAQVDAAVDQYNQGKSGVFDTASAYDEASGQFSAEKALSNIKLDKDKVRALAEKAVASLSTSVEVTDEDFAPLSGSLTKEQVASGVDAANQLIASTDTFKIAGNEVAALDSKTLASWIVFGQDATPSLDTEKLTAWAKDLAAKLNTVGTQRTYTRADGKQITVSGGSYGWSVDTAALTSAVQQAVANKQASTIDIPTKTTADSWAGAGQRDWGAYIDVDLAEQHARFYDASSNIVWESGFISGNVNKGNGTPTGIWKINTNNGASTLIGKTDPATGEPEYKTPVNFWMPFEGNAVGFHDASWQSTANFSNPEAYKTVGSHGCINLPPEKAEELHNLIKVGLCVVVHG